MILDRIVERKRAEVKALLAARRRAKKRDLVAHNAACLTAPPSTRGFRRALIDWQGVSLIAEVKKASPSKGVIRPDFDPVRIALRYQEAGAQAISVLTDGHFFQGALHFIPMVRDAVQLPVLRKDFIIDEVQIEQSSCYSADAILLIAAILDIHQLRDYQAKARELGMDVLVEVHDETELEMTLTAGSRLIGINNRNLQTFKVDLNTTFRLLKLIPPDIPVVSESGISSFTDIKRLAAAGVAAALVGETLMRADDQVEAVRTLMGWG